MNLNGLMGGLVLPPLITIYHTSFNSPPSNYNFSLSLSLSISIKYQKVPTGHPILDLCLSSYGQSCRKILSMKTEYQQFMETEKKVMVQLCSALIMGQNKPISHGVKKSDEYVPPPPPPKKKKIVNDFCTSLFFRRTYFLC